MIRVGRPCCSRARGVDHHQRVVGDDQIGLLA
jgi:hypothetical protein